MTKIIRTEPRPILSKAVEYHGFVYLPGITAKDTSKDIKGQTADVLAQIDPTTFKALLDQAVAKKAQDQALLTNAQNDLARYEQLAATNAINAGRSVSGTASRMVSTRANVPSVTATACTRRVAAAATRRDKESPRRVASA